MMWALILTKLKGFLTFVWEYKAVIIATLLMLFITVLRDDIRKAELQTIQVQTAYNDYKVKQQEAFSKAQIEAKNKEMQLLQEQQTIKDRYNEEIKTMSNDIASLTSSNSRMSDSLKTINERLSKAPEQQVRLYASTSTELLDFCSTRLVYYSGQAEQHRIAERRAVDSYNNLIDSYNSDNK